MTLRDLIDSPFSRFENLDTDLIVSQLLDLEVEVFDGAVLKKVVGSSCFDLVDCSGEVVTKLQLFL